MRGMLVILNVADRCWPRFKHVALNNWWKKSPPLSQNISSFRCSFFRIFTSGLFVFVAVRNVYCLLQRAFIKQTRELYWVSRAWRMKRYIWRSYVVAILHIINYAYRQKELIYIHRSKYTGAPKLKRTNCINKFFQRLKKSIRKLSCADSCPRPDISHSHSHTDTEMKRFNKFRLTIHGCAGPRQKIRPFRHLAQLSDSLVQLFIFSAYIIFNGLCVKHEITQDGLLLKSDHTESESVKQYGAWNSLL
jgi:hypothetical protein